jgi:hypothetical protein
MNIHNSSASNISSEGGAGIANEQSRGFTGKT